ncbi:MAG: acyltransferase [Methylovulum sp.]|nr:acyltransferase [Methylovulum sp.]
MSANPKVLVDGQSVFKMGCSVLHPNSIIEVRGANNTVEIGDNVKGRVSINIQGGGSEVIIKDNVNIMGLLNVVIRRGFSSVVIGAESTFQGSVRLFNHEPNSIEIGPDCMFAGDILAMTSDMHAIFDADNIRINPSAPIIIGNHVWIGAAVRLLKGVTLGNGSIVGMSSLVVRGQYPENCIVAGNPAKVVRENILWTRAIPMA